MNDMNMNGSINVSLFATCYDILAIDWFVQFGSKTVRVVIYSGSFCSPTSFSSFDNLHVSGPGLSVMEFCGVWVGVSLGGDDAGVLNMVVVVIFSRNPSNCFSDNALCNVSSGLMGGTPPNPSSTKSFYRNQ